MVHASRWRRVCSIQGSPIRQIGPIDRSDRDSPPMLLRVAPRDGWLFPSVVNANNGVWRE